MGNVGNVGNVGVAIGAAVIAGGLLAATGVLQQAAASQRPRRESLSWRLLISLARNRTWLMGLGTGVLSYAFQGVALAFGPLALVQPVFASELLFAAPVSVRLRKARLRAREWLGVVSVPAGLAISILLAYPRPGNPLPALSSWGVAIAIVGGGAGAAVLVGQRLRGPARASAFALAAAAVMALQSALLGATVAVMKHGIVATFTAWQAYSLLPVTAVGVLLVESAYQAGPLVASMPVMDAAEPSVAIAIGVTLFGERVRALPWHLAGAALGLALFFSGIVLLDTSPVVCRLQRKQDHVTEDDRPGTVSGRAHAGRPRREGPA